MTLMNRLKMIWIFVRLVSNPTQTELIFKGIDIVSQDVEQEPVRYIENYIMSIVSFRKMYEQKYDPPNPKMENLSLYAKDTFGSSVYNHMKQNNLQFDLFPNSKMDRPVNYLTSRVYQDHDLWHALLGLGVDVEDELALQAFGVAQFQSLIGVFLIAGGLLHLLIKNPLRVLPAFKKINEFYLLGQRTPFLLSVKLRDLFDLPLIQAQKVCYLDGI